MHNLNIFHGTKSCAWRYRYEIAFLCNKLAIYSNYTVHGTEPISFPAEVNDTVCTLFPGSMFFSFHTRCSLYSYSQLRRVKACCATLTSQNFGIKEEKTIAGLLFLFFFFFWLEIDFENQEL